MGPFDRDYEWLIVLLVLRPLVQPLYPKINQVIFVVPVALPLTEEIQQLFKHEVLKETHANVGPAFGVDHTHYLIEVLLHFGVGPCGVISA